MASPPSWKQQRRGSFMLQPTDAAYICHTQTDTLKRDTVHGTRRSERYMPRDGHNKQCNALFLATPHRPRQLLRSTLGSLDGPELMRTSVSANRPISYACSSAESRNSESTCNRHAPLSAEPICDTHTHTHVGHTLRNTASQRQPSGDLLSPLPPPTEKKKNKRK